MLPGSRRPLLGGLVAGPGRGLIEGLHVGNLQLLEIFARVAIVRHRRVIDADDALIVLGADDHRHGIAVKQQTERGFALFQFGNVDAQPDHAAIAGQTLLDQDAAAVGQGLFVTMAGMIELLEPLVDPFILAADRIRIVAARHALLQGVAQHRALFKEIGTLVVDLGVLLVPEDVAAVGIEKHDALRQNIDGLAQARIRASRIRNRRLGFRALAHDLADFGNLAALG